MSIQVGQVIHAYNGNECARVEALGFDWVVLRELDRPRMPRFISGLGLHSELEQNLLPAPMSSLCHCE